MKVEVVELRLSRVLKSIELKNDQKDLQKI